MSKYKVYISKECVEDNWNDGEVGKRQLIFNREYFGQEDTLKKAIETGLSNCLGEAAVNKHIYGNDFGVFYSRLENKDGKTPNEEELSNWKSGNINLYEATYYFDVEYSEDVNLLKELKDTIICNFKFTEE